MIKIATTKPKEHSFTDRLGIDWTILVQPILGGQIQALAVELKLPSGSDPHVRAVAKRCLLKVVRAEFPGGIGVNGEPATTDKEEVRHLLIEALAPLADEVYTVAMQCAMEIEGERGN